MHLLYGKIRKLFTGRQILGYGRVLGQQDDNILVENQLYKILALLKFSRHLQNLKIWSHWVTYPIFTLSYTALFERERYRPSDSFILYISYNNWVDHLNIVFFFRFYEHISTFMTSHCTNFLYRIFETNSHNIQRPFTTRKYFCFLKSDKNTIQFYTLYLVMTSH